MDTGTRAREDLRNFRLPEAHARGLHARGAERAVASARGGASSVLRAAPAPARHRRKSARNRRRSPGLGQAIGAATRTTGGGGGRGRGRRGGTCGGRWG